MKEIALAVNRAFKAMRFLADNGKVKFGDWVPKLAAELEKPLLRLYLQHMDKADAVVKARLHAMDSATNLLQTSREQLEDGQEPAVVFSAKRAASIGFNEGARATGASNVVKAGKRGKLTWQTSAGCCDDCKSLNGKSVQAGKEFVSKSGTKVFHEPLHPNCRCKTRVG